MEESRKSSKLIRAGSFSTLILLAVNTFVFKLPTIVFILLLLIAFAVWGYGWFLRLKEK